jgi:TRAP-type C4-dicarboxylate transport system substrate-binding protein
MCIARAARDFERKDSRDAASKAVDFLKQKGMQVTVVSDKELERMREKSRPAMQKFASDGHVKLIKDLQSDLEKVRK